jgi:hypothetical protein
LLVIKESKHSTDDNNWFIVFNRIRIKEKESLSSKRKGITLADPIKKLCKNEKTEDATTFQDFLQDMLEIS